MAASGKASLPMPRTAAIRVSMSPESSASASAGTASRARVRPRATSARHRCQPSAERASSMRRSIRPLCRRQFTRRGSSSPWLTSMLSSSRFQHLAGKRVEAPGFRQHFAADQIAPSLPDFERLPLPPGEIPRPPPPPEQDENHQPRDSRHGDNNRLEHDCRRRVPRHPFRNGSHRRTPRWSASVAANAPDMRNNRRRPAGR